MVGAPGVLHGLTHLMKLVLVDVEQQYAVRSFTLRTKHVMNLVLPSGDSVSCGQSWLGLGQQVVIEVVAVPGVPHGCERL